MPPEQSRPTAAAESYLGLLGIVLGLGLGAGLVYAMARTWTGWHTVLALLLVGVVAGIYAWRGRTPEASPMPPALLYGGQLGFPTDSLDYQRRVSALNALDQMRSRQMRDGLLKPPHSAAPLPDLWEVGDVATYRTDP